MKEWKVGNDKKPDEYIHRAFFCAVGGTRTPTPRWHHPLKMARLPVPPPPLLPFYEPNYKYNNFRFLLKLIYLALSAFNSPNNCFSLSVRLWGTCTSIFRYMSPNLPLVE